MDLERIAADLRAIRRRMGRTQTAVGRMAGLSGSTVSRIERGDLDGLTLASLRAVARVLEARLEVRIRWRGGDLDRLISGRHAGLAEAMTRRLVAAGWIVRPEVSFAFPGERGIVDLLCWHSSTRTLLVIEIKTQLVDVGETLGTLDRKRRLAPRIAAGLGWVAEAVGVVLVLAEGRTNRRRASAFSATLAAALPSDGRRVAAWFRSPSGALLGHIFLPVSREVGRRHAPVRQGGR